jgi:putative addiction module component (TIGR02574 family)
MEDTMPTLIEELCVRARTLSPEDRSLLVDDLLASLQEDEGPDATWDDEIGARVEQIKAGTVKLHASEDVHAEARQIYK